ncbi:MAG: hypothetical protein RMK45_10230 [Armatimonadota bacterium]|nr:hypothetical protein [Armatimonadota bacterium]
MTTCTSFDLHAVVQSLAQRRLVPRPRGDFDHALATEIHRRYPHASASYVNPAHYWGSLRSRLCWLRCGVRRVPLLPLMPSLRQASLRQS